MPPLLKNLPVDALAEEVGRAGIVCCDDVLPDGWLHAARDAVDGYLAQKGQRDFMVKNPAHESAGPFGDLINDPGIRGLLEKLAERYPFAAIDRETETVLRVLAGPEREGRPLWFHYDASVVTVVIAVEIPNCGPGQSGELVVVPNKRPFRRYVVANIVEKAFHQNALYRSWQVRRVRRRVDDHVVDLKPGSLCVFHGYRTFHANMPCAPGARRVTLLIHHGRPHGRHPALVTAKSLVTSLRRMAGRATTTIDAGGAPIPASGPTLKGRRPAGSPSRWLRTDIRTPSPT